MTPKEALEITKRAEKEMRKASGMSVDVGVLAAKVTGQIYDSGATVLEVAYKHEYGIGVPRRSFLRTPFLIKQKEIAKFIDKKFEAVFTGATDADTALGLVGVYATNVSQKAFTNEGYGTWEPLSEETIAAKGSSQILVDSGTLRNSIAWVVNK